MPATLAPLLDDMARSFGSERALVALVDSERRILRGAFGLNLPASLAEALVIPLSERGDPLVTALRTALPQHVLDCATDPRLEAHTREVLRELGFEQFVVTPIHSDIDSIGVIVLARSTPFSESDVSALIPFAGRAGAELQRVRDVELRDSSETAAVEKEWLWWMINAVADPVVVSDEQNESSCRTRSPRSCSVPATRTAEAQARRHDEQLPVHGVALDVEPAAGPRGRAARAS